MFEPNYRSLDLNTRKTGGSNKDPQEQENIK